MMTFEILLAFLFLIAIGLGLALRRLRSTDDVVAAPPRPMTSRPADEFYRPMARLFTRLDIEFLHEQSGYSRKMDRRLRLQRQRVLRLYLAQVREDFSALLNYCRQVARSSRNWELSSLAQRQRVVFYGVYFALQVRCLLGSFVHVRVDARDLVSSLRNLQQGLRSAAGPNGGTLEAAQG